MKQAAFKKKKKKKKNKKKEKKNRTTWEKQVSFSANPVHGEWPSTRLDGGI